MGKEDTLSVLNIQAENDRLNKRILFLERENREQRKELTDYARREKELLEEIDRLEGELDEVTFEKRPKYKPEKPAESVDDFLLPKVDTGTGLNRVGKIGFEEEWEDVMHAYTDEIFVESDKPDVLFYRDDAEKCFITPTGNTRLPFPILQEDLDRYNIIKVRPLTQEEVGEVCKEFDLT